MSRTNKTHLESPSKRLRNVYYTLYEQDDGGFDAFEDYYENKMEKLIKHFKKMIV